MIEVAYVFNEYSGLEYVMQERVPMVGDMITFGSNYCSEAPDDQEDFLPEFIGTHVIGHVAYAVASCGTEGGIRASLLSCEEALRLQGLGLLREKQR